MVLAFLYFGIASPGGIASGVDEYDTGDEAKKNGMMTMKRRMMEGRDGEGENRERR